MAATDQGNRQAADPELRAAAGVPAEEPPTLSISSEKVCHIVFKVRQFDVKDLPTVPDDGSDPPDEEMRSVLEDRPDDPVWQELAAFISALNVDEQLDLITLMWLGRGDGTLDDWYELRDTASGEHSPPTTARYLLGNPILGDHLAEGIALFGRSCEEFADEHLIA
jgi:hypothetical protein